MLKLLALIVLFGAGGLFALGREQAPTIPTAGAIDLPRFMGDWYVIANIPTFIEKDAYDAVESYALRPDGKIQTTYRQRRGGFDAKLKTMHPVGTVRPGTGNAVWGMQFVWPIKAEYVIAYVDADYTRTIVARSNRDYAWIMARTPTIPDAEYAALVDRLKALGYDTTKLRKVPQRTQGQ
jgi:apolipoprotein D and lipocalin family protein